MIETVKAVKGCIVLFYALTRCTLLHSIYDLKGIQMNMQRSLIRELRLHGFKVGHYAMEAIKIIRCR